MSSPAERLPEADTVKLSNARLPLAVRSFGLTDRGKKRSSNEDQFLIAELVKALQIQGTSLPAPGIQHSSDRCHLFVVADGMGAHAAGEKASALAIDSVESFMLETFKWFLQFKGQEQDELLAEFQAALRHANARVLAESAHDPELRGMGTTLTLAYSLNDVLFVTHVGDSRCYLYRGGVLYRLTRDHTLVEEMIRHGSLKAEDAAQHRWRHIITNAVGGGSAAIQVDVHKVYLEPDDVALLCSDGLSEMVSDEEIAGILRAENDPQRACKELVAGANAKGGLDNITVIVARFARDGVTGPPG